jgi:peptide-methionine (S)-S-oxide reductase
MMATETAVLGGGCFWCLEAVYLRLKGVREVLSGYAGGTHPAPTYREVCSGRTGHAEVTRIEFEPEEISFQTLLDIFFVIHDPTTPNRQGGDVGPQYRSIVLFANEEQQRIATETIRRFEEEKLFDDPIVTEVVPLTAFFPAEKEHHVYYDRNPNQPYCAIVISPKVAKARARFQELMRD